MLLDGVGEEGQQKLNDSAVAIVGCGGLGSIVAPYLAGAGVGTLILIDADTPHLSNLHRQITFKEEESQTKSKALSQYINTFNSDVKTIVIEQMLSKQNIDNILSNVKITVVIECTDDIITKYLVNDYCHIHNLPLVYGAIHKFEGYVSLFDNTNENSIHLRDIFPKINTDIPNCSEVGVLNTVAGIIGLLQANEALKYILGIGESLSGKLLTYNALSNDQFKIQLRKTFEDRLETIYEEFNYLSIKCAIANEITIDEYLEQSDQFKLVSILDPNDHEDIFDGEIERMPVSRINFHKLEKPSSTNRIFYCQSGVRSKHVVQKYLEQFPDAPVYSLHGGFEDYEERFMDEH